MRSARRTYPIANARDVGSLERAIRGLVGLRMVMAIPAYAEEHLGFGRLRKVKVAWSEQPRPRASWSVSTRGTRVLANGRYAAIPRLKMLVGRRVESLEVTYPRLSLVLGLEGGERIEVRPGRSDAASGVAYWVIRAPRRREITAGPGSVWYRAKLPRFIDDKWRSRVAKRKRASVRAESPPSQRKKKRRDPAN
ncbi:MAG TPA: hypothetical protein VFL36_05555 [Myxococcales bacterium]|nr:hypothetical protein [Myxococcales bacterium]